MAVPADGLTVPAVVLGNRERERLPAAALAIELQRHIYLVGKPLAGIPDCSVQRAYQRGTLRQLSIYFKPELPA